MANHTTAAQRHNARQDKIFETYKRQQEYKSEAAKKVLQLMDKDYTYQEALNKVLRDDTYISRETLEHELNKFI